MKKATIIKADAVPYSDDKTIPTPPVTSIIPTITKIEKEITTPPLMADIERQAADVTARPGEKKPTVGEYYIEEDGDDWSVFHTENSKCYATYSEKPAAQKEADRLNGKRDASDATADQYEEELYSAVRPDGSRYFFNSPNDENANTMLQQGDKLERPGEYKPDSGFFASVQKLASKSPVKITEKSANSFHITDAQGDTIGHADSKADVEKILKRHGMGDEGRYPRSWVKKAAEERKAFDVDTVIMDSANAVGDVFQNHGVPVSHDLLGEVSASVEDYLSHVTRNGSAVRKAELDGNNDSGLPEKLEKEVTTNPTEAKIGKEGSPDSGVINDIGKEITALRRASNKIAAEFSPQAHTIIGHMEEAFELASEDSHAAMEIQEYYPAFGGVVHALDKFMMEMDRDTGGPPQQFSPSGGRDASDVNAAIASLRTADMSPTMQQFVHNLSAVVDNLSNDESLQMEIGGFMSDDELQEFLTSAVNFAHKLYY